MNAAVYQIDWNDIQVTGTSDVGEVPITVNGGTAETRGIELSTQWAITDSLQLVASIAFNDAQLTSDAPGLVDGEDAFDGDRLSGSPEQQGTLLLDYTRPLDNGWTLNANYSLICGQRRVYEGGVAQQRRSLARVCDPRRCRSG